MSGQIHNFDDLSPQAFEFHYRGHDYVLKEPSESAALAFRQAQLKNAKMVDGKVTTDIERIYDSQSLLVASCTFLKTKDKEGKEVEQPAKVEVVRGFSSKVVRDLFDRAREMGGLNEDDSEEGLTKQISALETRLQRLRESKAAPKNEQAAGTGTSP